MMNGENQPEAPLSSRIKSRKHLVPKANSVERIPPQEIIYPKLSLNEVKLPSFLYLVDV